MACEDYWNAAHGRSYTLCGRIRDKYIELGGPGRFLGAPTSGEILNPDGVGKRASFEGNSSIYWHPDTDAHQIGGDIGKRWGELRWEASYLGYPTTDELSTPNGQGRLNHFEMGSIYWSGTSGAHDLTAELVTLWGALGWEEGELGFPTRNAVRGPDYDPTVRAQAVNPFPQQARFQRGYLTINQAGEAFAQVADRDTPPSYLSEIEE